MLNVPLSTADQVRTETIDRIDKRGGKILSMLQDSRTLTTLSILAAILAICGTIIKCTYFFTDMSQEIASHGSRLDTIEPKVDKIQADTQYMRAWIDIQNGGPLQVVKPKPR